MKILSHFHNPQKGNWPSNLYIKYVLDNKVGVQINKLKTIIDEKSIVDKEELAVIKKYLKDHNLQFRDLNPAYKEINQAKLRKSMRLQSKRDPSKIIRKNKN